jgi:hypothetical protein
MHFFDIIFGKEITIFVDKLIDVMFYCLSLGSTVSVGQHRCGHAPLVFLETLIT